MQCLAWARARMAGRTDSEHRQALLRIAIVWALLPYTSWIASQDPGVVSQLWGINLASAMFSVLLFLAILKDPSASPPRRVVGAIHDNLAVTLWLHAAGAMGALYLFVYPFVTVGNGFRYGVRYLAWSGLLGALGIGSLLAFAPDWQSYRLIGIGVLLSHILVAGYVGALLARLHQVQGQLQHLATYDPLTGLPNRRLWLDTLARVLADRRHRNIACLYVDLDGFKTVNDRAGHAVGDQLLKLVADAIARSVRRSDLSARLGGDEFAVILDGVTSPGDAGASAARVIRAVGAIGGIGGHPVAISASVGIAYLPADQSRTPVSAEEMMTLADAAMYRAKKTGRGQYLLLEFGSEASAAARGSRLHGALIT